MAPQTDGVDRSVLAAAAATGAGYLLVLAVVFALLFVVPYLLVSA